MYTANIWPFYVACSLGLAVAIQLAMAICSLNHPELLQARHMLE